jgi:hypothetical protein
MRRLDPNGDGIADVNQRFFRRFPVAHAAGEIRNSGDEAAAIFLRQRFHDDGIF